MTPHWIKKLRFTTGGLALLAALACSLLPGGFLPKVAGPCGRELCNCAPEPVDEKCRLCKVAPSVHFLTLDTSISAAETPGVALQVIFSGLLAPQHVAVFASGAEMELKLPSSRLFPLSENASDILTPPPRA